MVDPPRPIPEHFDPNEMSLRGRIGAYRLHAKHDPKETTAKARETFLNRFEREVDPDGILPEAERVRRAEAARRKRISPGWPTNRQRRAVPVQLTGKAGRAHEHTS
jgi:hypothetical protein